MQDEHARSRRGGGHALAGGRGEGRRRDRPAGVGTAGRPHDTLLPWLWLDADATLAGTPVADLAAVAADAPGVRRQEPERHRLLAGTDDVAPLRPARPDALGREAT